VSGEWKSPLFPGFRRKPGSTLGYFPPTLRGENTDQLLPMIVVDFLLTVGWRIFQPTPQAGKPFRLFCVCDLGSAGYIIPG